tara:strand:- start:110712 stop:110900 length:189 start_codon:yes stop_codon:yes gene_type:complete
MGSGHVEIQQQQRKHFSGIGETFQLINVFRFYHTGTGKGLRHRLFQGHTKQRMIVGDQYVSM